MEALSVSTNPADKPRAGDLVLVMRQGQPVWVPFMVEAPATPVVLAASAAPAAKKPAAKK